MKATLTEYYVLVETDDIDFSTLRLAVDEYRINNSVHRIDELQLALAEPFLKELKTFINTK